MSVPVADRQQGLPVRAGRDRARRPAHPGRRVRRRRRRRHGVDDQRAAPAAEVARGLQVRRRRRARLDGARRPDRRLRPVPMGESTERVQRAARHRPATSRTSSPPARTSGPPRPQKNGLFDEEIVPVQIPQRKGDPIAFAEDEGIRGGHHGRVARPSCARRSARTARSPPARRRRSPTARCAVVVMSKAKAEELGLTWLAEIGAHGIVAGPDDSCSRSRRTRSSTRSRKDGLDRRRPRPGRDQRGVRRGRLVVDARPRASPTDKVNVNGGAIALGHPIGMSGARLVLHLALELRRRGGGLGAAALCGGGGQGDALLLRVPSA